jgi:hypothetical protein
MHRQNDCWKRHLIGHASQIRNQVDVFRLVFSSSETPIDPKVGLQSEGSPLILQECLESMEEVYAVLIPAKGGSHLLPVAIVHTYR